MEFVVEVPTALADDLLAVDVAGIAVQTRSSATQVQAMIDIVGVASGLTSILVDAADIPDIARRLVAWARRSPDRIHGAGSGLVIRVHAAAGTDVTISIDESDGVEAVDIEVTRVEEALSRIADLDVVAE
jgi:hypothetical protein